MEDIQIICDSLADIPKEIIEEYNIEIVPLTIILDEIEYKDGIDIITSEFYKKLKESDVTPKTSQATYAQFENIFNKYIDKGKTILYISGSSKVTGTYQSAMMAKNNIGKDIYIFDSLNLSYGCGAQVVKACELVEKGYSVVDIIKELEIIRKNIYVLFAVDTLEYLKKGGRLSATKATVGTILNIKPLIEVKDGILKNVAQVRGRKNITAKMIELAKLNITENLDNKTIIVGHGDNMSELIKLKEILNTENNINNPLQIEIGPSIGSHTGPGSLGICIY